MKVLTPEISWHPGKDGEGKNDPILSLEFHPSGVLVTAGHDAIIRFWKLALPTSLAMASKNNDTTTETKTPEGPSISCLVELAGHIRAVNVVRFSPNYECLASAGDDGKAIVWYANRDLTSPDWSWADITSHKELSSTALSGHGGDVTDVAWSPDGTRIVTASIDNTAIIWNVRTGKSVQIIRDHNHYVQGVAWDVFDQFIATQSCDRTCRLYGHYKNKPICTAKGKCRCVQRAVLRHRKFENKTAAPATPKPTEAEGEAAEPQQKSASRVAHKKHLMFLDDTVPTFFRRPCFSPCGSMLFSPTGQFINKGSERKVVKTTFMHLRNQWERPVFHYPGYSEASLVVKCCPVLFKRAKRDGVENIPGLDYRVVFAIATIDEVLIYDTQCYYPIIAVKNIHYATITDLAWACDGTMLAVSSQDGYCTFISLVAGELGEPLPHAEVPEVMKRTIPRVFGAKAPAETKTSSPLKPPAPEISAADKTTADAAASTIASAAIAFPPSAPAPDSHTETTPVKQDAEPKQRKRITPILIGGAATAPAPTETTPVKQDAEPKQRKRITPILVGGVTPPEKRKSPDYGFGSRPKRQRTTEVPVDTQADEDSDSDFDVEEMDEESFSDDEGEATREVETKQAEVAAAPKPKRITPTFVAALSLKTVPMSSTVPAEPSAAPSASQT